VLDLDSLNKNDFISSGNDRSIVLWKTEKQTQMIFEGHDYAIDRVRAVNEEKFITASQDGSVNLWSQKRKKPIYKYSKAH
jgi:ribosomal RNA-processing protein 9